MNSYRFGNFSSYKLWFRLKPGMSMYLIHIHDFATNQLLFQFYFTCNFAKNKCIHKNHSWPNDTHCSSVAQTYLPFFYY